MKKVLIVIRYLKLGGTEKRLLRIIKNLPMEKYKFYLLCSNNGHNEFLVEQIRNFRNVEIIAFQKNFLMKFFFVVRNKYDIILCFNNFLGLALGIFLNVTKKICIEGGNRALKWNFIKKILDKYFIFKLCDGLLVNSNFMKNILLQRGCSEKKIKVIKNGIEDINTLEINYYKTCQSDEFVCVTVSRLTKIKNIPELLKIFFDLSTNHIKLMIIGYGEEYTNLQQMIINYKLDKKVFLLGEKNEKEIVNIFFKSDLFLFVSLSESLPNVLIEALRSSLPIIAYDNGGISEIVNDGYNGFLIPNGDSKLFAKKILELYNNRHLLSELKQNARKSYLENFTISRMIREIDEYFEN